jgi:uncharacterized membrane protein YdbT with pleckstrin-like domain
MMEAPSEGAYADYLGADETPRLQVRRHWVVLVKPAAQMAFVVLVAWGLGALVPPRRGGHPLDTVLGIVVAFFLARLLYKAVEWWIDRVLVTDQRMLEISGILTRRIASMPLAKLTDLTFSRTLPGRILGYGDLVVETPGQEQALTHIDYLPRPNDFYKGLTTLVLARFTEARPDSEVSEHEALEEDVDIVPPDLADTQEFPPVRDGEPP